MRRFILLAMLIQISLPQALYSLESGPIGVFPGGGKGEAVIGDAFPTFSWSFVDGAVGYRLEVFKFMQDAITHDEILEKGELVLTAEIPAPALCWSPSGNEILKSGVSYVWYVTAIDSKGEGLSSMGNRFKLDGSVALTSIEEAVKEKVREYIRTDSEIIQTIRGISGDKADRQVSAVIEDEQGEPFENGTLRGTEGESNTFYGKEAGKSSTGSSNTFIGRSAGYENKGLFNTFLGWGAGHQNATGSDNTFVGSSSGEWNTSGSSNTFLGQHSGFSNSTGYSNTFIGHESGEENTTGASNTFLGTAAGPKNTVGNFNTMLGQWAGYSNISGNYNTFLGNSAGGSNSTGSLNTCIGVSAGYSNSAGNGNIFVGYMAGYNEKGSNKLYIHNSNSSNPLVYGEFDKRTLKINGTLSIADVSTPSDIDLKKEIEPLNNSLEKITNLRGISFRWRTDEYPDSGLGEGRQVGLIAQEVEKVLPELVRTDAEGRKSLSYDKLTAVLVEAVKAQHARMEKQQEEIEELKALVRKLAAKRM